MKAIFHALTSFILSRERGERVEGRTKDYKMNFDKSLFLASGATRSRT